MMNAWKLPSTLTVGGISFNIRTDFRAILDVLDCFNSDEYEDDEKILIALTIIYTDFDDMPVELYEEALTVACEFIDMGMDKSDKQRPSMMNWTQDAPLIVSAVYQTTHCDVRTVPHLHWWTFLSAYMEIGDSLYSAVLNIRRKLATGKKLEKYEREFLNENRHLIDLHTPETDEVRREKDNILRILDGD